MTPPPQVDASSAPDYADPKANLAAFMKLQLSQESGELAYFYEGVVYGCPQGGPVQPLFSYHGLLRYLVRRTGALSWDTTYRDVGYFGNLDTGEPITAFKNPYTGKLVKPEPFVEGPGRSSTTPTRSVFHVCEKALVTDKDFHLPFRLIGGAVWMEYDLFVKTPNPLTVARWPLASTGDVLPISSITLFRGDRAAFEDPAVSSVPNTRFLDTSILPWAPWMLMGRRPGWLTYRGTGWKVADLAEVPDRLLANIRKLHPEQLAPPSRWPLDFETVWTRFAAHDLPQ